MAYDPTNEELRNKIDLLLKQNTQFKVDLELKDKTIKRQVRKELEAAKEGIENRDLYELNTPEETRQLLKLNPFDHNYSSDDFWKMGKYHLADLFNHAGSQIFYHVGEKDAKARKNGEPAKKTKFVAPLLSTYLQIIHPIITIRPENFLKDPGDMWYWFESTGTYIQGSESRFAETIKDMWRDAFNNRMLKPTFDNIRYQTYMERDDFVLDPEFFAVQNGLLWIHQVGEEWIVEEAPTTPDLFITSRLPVSYDKEAKAPKWIKFLNEILPNQKREITWIQEYMGYCLYRSWPYDRVIIMLGDGDNGKSTLLTMIRTLLGNENCPTIGLWNLCNGKWYLAHLYKKLANIDADTSTKDLQNTSNFKTATGGDQIMGERKGKDPFFFSSFCKHFMSVNKMPYCYDDTDAFYRRWFIIKFFESFPVGDPRRNPNLEKELSEELPGILNWALEGLVRLLSNNGFTNPPTTPENKAEWNRLSNPIYSFIYSNLVVIDYEGEYNCQEFWEAFEKYTKKHKLSHWNKDKLGKRMNHHIDFVSKGRAYYVDDKDFRPYVWKGIRPPTTEEMNASLYEYAEESK